MGLGRTITLCGLLLGLATSASAKEDSVAIPPYPTAVAETNSEYVQEVGKGINVLIETFYNGSCVLAGEIAEKLANAEFVNPTGEFYSEELWNNPSKEDLEQISSGQLIRTYALMNALSKPEFREKIGEELVLDTQDKSGEHGGVLRLNPDGSVKVEMIKNTFRCGQMEIRIGSHGCDADKHYSPDSIGYRLDILLPFHFHAIEIEYSKSAALSGGDFFWGPQAVFTSVGEGKFNVDVALFYKKDEKPVSVNLDLGVYHY